MLIDCGVLYSRIGVCVCACAHVCTCMQTSIIQNDACNHRDPHLKEDFPILARLTLLFVLDTTTVSAHSFSEELFHYIQS